MRRIALPALALFAAFALTSCSKSTNTNSTNAGNKNTTSNANNTNASSNANTSSGSFSTPTAAYKASYEAAMKRDIAGLKATFSKNAIAEAEKVAQAANMSVDEMLKSSLNDPEDPLPPTMEVRNEKIEGDKATLEYKNGKGVWEKVNLTKEGGSWKLDVTAAKEIEGEKDSGAETVEEDDEEKEDGADHGGHK